MLAANGVEIPTSEPFYVTSQKIEKVTCNGVLVWELLNKKYIGSLYSYSSADTCYPYYSLDGVTFTVNTAIKTKNIWGLRKRYSPYVFDEYYVTYSSESETSRYFTKDGETYSPLSDLGINADKIIYYNGKYYAILSETTALGSNPLTYVYTLSLYYKNKISDSAWTLLGQKQTVTGGVNSSSDGAYGTQYELQDAMIINSKLYALWTKYNWSSSSSGNSSTASFVVTETSIDTAELIRTFTTSASISGGTLGTRISFAAYGGERYLVAGIYGYGYLYYVDLQGTATSFTAIGFSATWGVSNVLNSNIVNANGYLCFYTNSYLFQLKDVEDSFNTSDYITLLLGGAYIEILSEAGDRLYYAGASSDGNTTKGYIVPGSGNAAVAINATVTGIKYV